MNRAAEDLAVADGFELKYKFSSDEEYKEYHKVYNQTIQDKMEQIIAGGYKIYTSINPALQSDLENKVTLNFLNMELLMKVPENMIYKLL